MNQFSEYFQSINDPKDIFYQAYEDILFFNERYLRGEIQTMFEELNVPTGSRFNAYAFLKHGTNGLFTYLHNLCLKNVRNWELS